MISINEWAKWKTKNVHERMKMVKIRKYYKQQQNIYVKKIIIEEENVNKKRHNENFKKCDQKLQECIKYCPRNDSVNRCHRYNKQQMYHEDKRFSYGNRK